MTKKSLLNTRQYYKPFWYDWAYKAFEKQQAMHWSVKEVSLGQDVNDWNEKLTDNERHLITQIFRFFTQADVDIANAYLSRYIPLFKPPEIQMMLTQFASMEALHIQAYSILLDQIGMPEIEYKAFLDYKAMVEKHEYYFKRSTENLTKEQSIALDLAVFSAFGEGLQLFASFIMILSFSRRNLLTKMGRIITWSIKDESLHVESMIKLFHVFREENPQIWTDEFKGQIYQTCRDMVQLEDNFIDLAFEMGDIEGLKKLEVHNYIRFIADRRLLQLGLKPNYGVKHNPLPWIEDFLSTDEFVNFFEHEVTEYSTGLMTGKWSDVYTDDLFEEDKIIKHIKGR